MNAIERAHYERIVARLNARADFLEVRLKELEQRAAEIELCAAGVEPQRPLRILPPDSRRRN